MSRTCWTLSDVDRDVFLETLTLGPAEAGDMGGPYSIRKRLLRGGLRDGINVVEIDNGSLRFVVLPDRGLGLWRATAGDVQLGWRSPVRGPVHPKFVPLFEPGGLGWLSGFDELLCRCGLESNGPPQFDDKGRLQLPLHGRIANLPAHYVEVACDASRREISLTGIVDEARLFGNKLRLESTVTTRLGQASLRIVDRITNIAGEPAELELLYHINLGHPLLSPEARLHAPLTSLAPRDAHSASDVKTWDRYAKPQAGKQEFAHFATLAADSSGWTQVLLEGADGKQGMSLEFNHQQLPCFTLWKSQLLLPDGYVTGLEPGINYPNLKTFEREQGRVAVLKPGETRQFELELAALDSAESMALAKDRIQALAEGTKPQIHQRPRAGWSPAS